MTNVEQLIDKTILDLGDKKVYELYKSQNKGKMIRAKLALIIGGDEAQKLASVIEIIHLASLLHDDVIDDSLLRRGGKSVFASSGSKTAIMLGDILYAKGFYELSCLENKELAKVVSNAVVKLSLGELKDVELSKSFNVDLEAYLDMIYLKTASLIEATCISASLVAKIDPKQNEAFGRLIGLSFQIIDDILDLTQDEQTLKKPPLSDFKEGKTTMPYIYLYQDLDANDKKTLLSYFGIALDDEQKAWIKSMMNKHKSIEKSKQYALSLAQEARSLTSDQKLLAIVDKIVHRSF